VTCPYLDHPPACLEEKNRRHLAVRPRESIPCDYCPAARKNALAAHVPEADREPIMVHRRNDGYTLHGPPCPTCKKPRPARENVDPDQHCMDCKRKDPAYLESRRKYQRKYWRKYCRDSGEISRNAALEAAKRVQP